VPPRAWGRRARRGLPRSGLGPQLDSRRTVPGGGRIATVVIRNHRLHPLQDPNPYNHDALVATLQAAFGLGCEFNGAPLGFTCDRANGVN